MSVLNKPQIEAYIGGTGSGKGVSINRRLAELAPARLIMWDPRDEYGHHAPGFESIKGLIGAFKAARGGPIRARYVTDGKLPIEEAFRIFCTLAFEDQKKREALGMAPQTLVVVAEELSDVTKPSYAPPAWRRCITQGRHVGLHLIGCTQRPALIDKSFMSAATQVRCFMLGYDDDIKAMAKELRCTEDQVGALTTTEDESVDPKRTTIEYLERIRRTRELFGGTIVIQGKKFDETRQLVGDGKGAAPAATPKPTARKRARST